MTTAEELRTAALAARGRAAVHGAARALRGQRMHLAVADWLDYMAVTHREDGQGCVREGCSLALNVARAYNETATS